MKRGGWLKRGGGLKRSGYLNRKRKARASRSEVPEIETRFREETLHRAGNICERCGSLWKLQAHHLVPRSRGKGWALLHDAEANGAALCGACHSGVHDHTIPDWRDWIRARPEGI